MSESTTPSSITQTPPVPTVETPVDNVVVPEKKLPTVQKKVETEIVDNFQKQNKVDSKLDKNMWSLIKEHPLYAPWRDMEDMQFPEKKEKIKKLKASLSDKNASDKDRSGNADKMGEKQVEKEKKNTDKNRGKDEKKAERAKEKAERKAKRKEKRAKFNEKVTLNPFSRVRYWWKETLKTAFSLPANIIAKAAHIVGRPQSLFVGEMWSDLAKNTGRWFVNLFRTIWWTVYKPYRTKLPYENIFKDYWASFNPEWSKWLSALGLWLLRWFWSIPRIPAQLVEWVAHTVSETATGKFDYTHTTDAFKKAFSIIHDKPASSPDTAKK